MKTVDHINKRRITLVAISSVIILVSLAISLPGGTSSGPCWSDGMRYTFNGILIHDMIRDGGFWSPYDYAEKFYAQYPATNLPYGPPFFALVFAVAFSLLGISFSVARYVVTSYTVLAAFALWLMVYSINRHQLHSIISVLFFLLNPLTAIYSRDITPELPVAFYSALTI